MKKKQLFKTHRGQGYIIKTIPAHWEETYCYECGKPDGKSFHNKKYLVQYESFFTSPIEPRAVGMTSSYTDYTVPVEVEAKYVKLIKKICPDLN